MAIPQTLSEALDNLYTTTWQEMKTVVHDQIFDATPFWFWMKENGALESVSGGRFLTEPLRYAKSDKVKFIGRGGTVSLGDIEFLTEATEDWKFLVDSIVRFGVDDMKNRGKKRIISLMNAKLANSRDSLVDKIESTLPADNSANPLDFIGLQTMVADDPTTGTVHGIDPATNTWWRNKTKDMAGLSFAINGHTEMRTMLNDTSNNIRNDTPNIILSGQTPYERYEDLVVEQKRIVNKKLGDAGFENIEFKGIPMIWSPSVANTRMYFLNTKFLKFKFDPSLNFDMTEWKPIPDQVNDRAAQIILAGNLMTGRRRVHGVLFNLDTE